jgi:endonuclease/exonuclease/phosphatase family metal-dependent hydrolase
VSRWRVLVRQPTYPSGHPRLQLDYVLADPRGAARLGTVAQVDAPELAVSDHRALVVRFG